MSKIDFSQLVVNLMEKTDVENFIDLFEEGLSWKSAGQDNFLDNSVLGKVLSRNFDVKFESDAHQVKWILGWFKSTLNQEYVKMLKHFFRSG
jgi:hypothetical protein